MRDQVALFGYIGGGNAGDDLMVASAIGMLGSDHKLVLLAREPARLAYLSNDGLTIAPASSASFLRILPSLFRLIRCGGTIFHDETGTTASRAALLYLKQVLVMLAARLVGCEVVLLGVGIGRVERPSTKILLSIALRLANRSILRDRESFDYAESIVGNRARLGLDLVFCDSSQPHRADTACSGLAVSVVDLARYGHLPGPQLVCRWVNFIGRAMMETGVSSASLVTFKDNDVESDRPVAEQIKEELERQGFKVTVVAADPESITHAIETASIVIATRYHSAVLAARAGRPMILVPYNEKLRRFANDFGLERSVADLTLLHEPPSPGQVSPPELHSRLRTMQEELAGLGSFGASSQEP